MHKEHIGKNGAGTVPYCSKGFRGTNGMSTTVQGFAETKAEYQCKRCLKHLPRLLALDARKKN